MDVVNDPDPAPLSDFGRETKPMNKYRWSPLSRLGLAEVPLM
jgi:hypothetical protein